MVSETENNIKVTPDNRGLNPCFSGGWSRSTQTELFGAEEGVLILVLVEDGLGVRS